MASSNTAVKRLPSKLREKVPVVAKIKRADRNPWRRLVYSLYESKKVGNRYCIILEIKDQEIQLLSTANEKDAASLLQIACDVIPCFWSPKVSSHVSAVFTDKVLTKLVELMRLYGNSWSVAHMCVSLPLPEDTMMILLASDSFKDHFTSTHHPKGYTLLHLAVEMNSVSACRAIMRCSDNWLICDPGFHIEDYEGVNPIQKAVVHKAWACLEYLLQCQSPYAFSHPNTPPRLRKFSFGKTDLQQFWGAVEGRRPSAVRKMLSYNPDFANAGHIDGGISLHKAHDHETIIALIEKGADPQTRNLQHETPLHTIIKTLHPIKGDSLDDKWKKAAVKKQKCVLALLIYGHCDPDSKTRSGMTSLHLAVETCDVLTVKALLAFNADTSVVNDQGESALDIATKIGFKETINLLQHGEDSLDQNLTQPTSNWPPVFSRRNSYAEQPKCPTEVATQREALVSTLIKTCEKLQGTVDQCALDQLLACAVETFDYSVNQQPIGSRPRQGDRVLCLDGGGIRGLILIELLCAIEKVTGKRIVDLFDWIIGTSTGGILALALVYTNLSLNELRCLYFRMKDKVFHRVWDIVPHSDTEVFEEMIKSLVSEHRTLGCKTHPRVLITATDIESVPPKLVFFSNYEDGELGKDMPIWVAARATSAAPVFFEHYQNYADGGIKANNPSSSGLARIHEYYKETGRTNYKISTVVSLGCGDYTAPALCTDIHKCLSNSWKPLSIIKNAKDLFTTMGNLLKVLQKEVSESNGQPVVITRTLCDKSGSSFYRLSPKLETKVELDEKNDEKLVDMLIVTKQYIQAEMKQFIGIKRDTETHEQLQED